MSATDDRHTAEVPTDANWVNGAIAGLVASVVTGIVVFLGFDPAIMTEHIPSAVGLRGALSGWAVMLVIGLVAGIIYAAVAGMAFVASYATHPRYGGLVGLAYGLVLWAVAAVIVPLIVGDGGTQVGTYAVSLEGILVYGLFGVVIGAVYLLVPLYRG